MDKQLKSYLVCTCTDSDFYIPGALHIERNDDLMMVKDDVQASIEAEKDGVKLIYGMMGVPNQVYVDTEENKEVIKQALLSHPEYMAHGTINMLPLNYNDLEEGMEVLVVYDKSDSTWVPEIRPYLFDGIEKVHADKTGNLYLVDKNGSHLTDVQHYLNIEGIEIFAVEVDEWN